MLTETPNIGICADQTSTKRVIAIAHQENCVPAATPAFYPKRVCIAVGTACNVECTYCLRLAGKIREPREVTPAFKNWLRTLTPETTEAVVINGGEPLLYVERIKEIFECVHPDIHRCIMTNGVLLTDEIVDWVNSIDCELHFSHEGLAAEKLKGVDVLKDPAMVRRLNRVNAMRIYHIVTTATNDVMQGWLYISEKIDMRGGLGEGRHFTVFPMYAFAGNEDLVKDFDWVLFARSYMDFLISYRKMHKGRGQPHHNLRHRKKSGFQMGPDGTVVSLADMKVYGTIWESFETLYQRMTQAGDTAFCDAYDCACRNECRAAPQSANAFFCRCMNIQYAVNAFVGAAYAQQLDD